MLLALALTACGSGGRTPACGAYDALAAAIREVEAARPAAAGGDTAAVERRVAAAERLIRVGRGRADGAAANARTGAAVRAMLEAANYLEFITGQYRSTARLDFSLTQFASRELRRAAAGAGGAPLNC